ncbi:hypothetical protein QL093DRAFT_1381536 [Fusarium oxysporum]|nr:hypothetical protein QL093DRAFT_1381536 [Fusarium oxysporum]
MAPIKPLGEQPDKPVPRVPKTHLGLHRFKRRTEGESTSVGIPHTLITWSTSSLVKPYYSIIPSSHLTLPLDPVLYERLVKRFQSASEREAEGKAKGYGRTLEADLQRGESKLKRLKDGDLESSGGDLEHPWRNQQQTKPMAFSYGMRS